MYEYESSLITGDVTGHKNFRHLLSNVIYIRFATVCTNSQGGDRPRFQNVPGLNVECHTYIPGWRRLQTLSHTHTHKHKHMQQLHCGGIYCIYVCIVGVIVFIITQCKNTPWRSNSTQICVQSTCTPTM